MNKTLKIFNEVRKHISYRIKKEICDKKFCFLLYILKGDTPKLEAIEYAWKIKKRYDRYYGVENRITIIYNPKTKKFSSEINIYETDIPIKTISNILSKTLKLINKEIEPLTFIKYLSRIHKKYY